MTHTPLINITSTKPTGATSVPAIDWTAPAIDLSAWDVIIVNTSAGKDSLAMLHYVVTVARAQGALHKVVVVHCDLGQVEWTGTRDLAQKQCDLYGVPLHIITRPQGDLLHHVEHERGMFPGKQERFCTSDHKRGQVEVLMTALTDAYINEHYPFLKAKERGRVRILNCMGLRAQESGKRKARPEFSAETRASNKTKRQVAEWLPIKWWSTEQVWQVIRENNLPYHYAYDLGMPRLSCVFCIFAPPEALLLAGYHNMALLREYVRIEAVTGHAFTFHKPKGAKVGKQVWLRDVLAQLENGYVPQGAINADTWDECA